MQGFLKVATAATVVAGPFRAIADGYTACVSLTTQAGRYIVNGTGAAFTASTWTHDANGSYLVGLSTTHTGTVGRLRLTFTDAATYYPVTEDFVVLPALIYDSFVGGTDTLQTDIAQCGGATVAAGAIPNAAAGATGGLPLFDSISTLADLKASCLQYPKKNIAFNNFPFMIVKKSNPLEPIASSTAITAERSIDGAAFAACTNAATYVADGMFRINLSTTDLNGNTIILRFTPAAVDAAIRYLEFCPQQ